MSMKKVVENKNKDKRQLRQERLQRLTMPRGEYAVSEETQPKAERYYNTTSAKSLGDQPRTHWSTPGNATLHSTFDPTAAKALMRLNDARDRDILSHPDSLADAPAKYVRTEPVKSVTAASASVDIGKSPFSETEGWLGSTTANQETAIILQDYKQKRAHGSAERLYTGNQENTSYAGWVYSSRVNERCTLPEEKRKVKKVFQEHLSRKSPLADSDYGTKDTMPYMTQSKFTFGLRQGLVPTDRASNHLSHPRTHAVIAMRKENKERMEAINHLHQAKIDTRAEVKLLSFNEQRLRYLTSITENSHGYSNRETKAPEKGEAWYRNQAVSESSIFSPSNLEGSSD